ncbi:hypothetical protein B0I35DRAFT_473405 [Stachybotrys elegans]|uniref:RNA polymerase II degradation factor 1 n=1 Tax=Stachybotrys elegans TaxID=80388 RepID=A0A8K0T226_9HYPO|nr:hypothetical protein B0I35DRAFT_473405 [Stachybotrys elegans]
MSEVVSRPAASRGRGSGRGGRGGFAGRGGRRTNGDKADHRSDDTPAAFDDEGDFADLRKQYGGKTSVIREMFPDWSEVDVLFALQETNGDENEAVARIAEGTISQWGEVSKPKKTTRPKAKEPTTASANHEAPAAGSRSARGGRSVSEGGRGRGRATERGGRAGRGRSAHPSTNESRNKEGAPLSVPTEESSAWDNDNTKKEDAEEKIPVAEPAEPAAPAAPPVKTWASMLRQSTAPKPVPKPKETPAPAPAPTEPQPTEEPTEPVPETTEPEPEPEEESTPVAKQAETVPQPKIVEPEIALPPSKDELTETNLEQVIDESKPPATGTAASTAADSWDPRQAAPSTTATPISAAQQQHQPPRPAIPGGFTSSGLKATVERPGRVSSFQRRVLDQEEAVRMPGNREVDRAAVQFGAFNLNGGDEDIDGDREEPETRAQPPADSPIAHPRASLPPASQPASVPETFSQKPAPAVPSGAAPAAAAAAPQATNPAPAAQPPVANAHPLGRYGQAGPQDVAQKPPLDPFVQQNTPPSQPPFDGFSSQTSQPPTQQPGGAFTSAPGDYSSYYTANHDRNVYNNFYGAQYGQQGQGQEAMGSQRGFGAYNAAQNDNLSQYPQSGVHNQPRFGGNASEAQNSGHSTPNPTAQGQQQQGQQGQQQAGQQPQPGQQQAAPGSQQQSHNAGAYPYSHPYYSNPYYHQYYSNYGQGNFGPYGKGAMYGQPYGVSPNAPYDHASSPASFGQSSLHRDGGIGSGLGEYGRGGSSQGGSQPGLGGSSFGSVHDSFARGGSGFPSQGQSYSNQGQPGGGASGDDLKPFGDAKSGSGPSPSLGGARPGSATNTAAAGQSGLPPPQSSQMGGGYGGYPSHLQGHGLHGNSGYGMGAGAGANQHGSSPYGSYSQGFGSGGYYGGGQQQQRGGWGGNYH